LSGDPAASAAPAKRAKKSAELIEAGIDLGWMTAG
jgi:hypothetical protein